MTQLSRFAAALGIVCSALAFGCGGGEEKAPANGTSNFTDPVQLCQEIVKVECRKIYACAAAAPALIALLQLPPTEADCNAQIKDALACANATADKVCAGDMSSPLAKGNACLDQFKAAEMLDCSVIISHGRDVSSYAPACGQCAPL